MKQSFSRQRRGLLGGLIAAVGAAGMGRSAKAYHTPSHFSDEPPPHRVVYQLNKADSDYQGHILFSVGELLRKFGDDIHLVVVAIGPGLHLLGKHPGRPVKTEHQQRVESLAAYGVDFHACGNTMKSLGWTKDDLLDVAEVVEIGAEDLMRLQEQGFAYISW